MSAHTWTEQAIKNGATLTARSGFGGTVEVILRWSFAPAIHATGKSIASALESLESKVQDDAASDILKAGGA